MSYRETYAEHLATFLKVCHLLDRRLYVTGHGGNLAWKLEEDLVLITPTKMNKGEITKEDLVFVALDGTVREGKRKPTGELPMYVRFFRERPDVSSVLHCHPPAAGAFALTTSNNLLARPYFPETVTEVGPVPVVPYGQPLTERLAANFAPFLPRHNAFLMENHGLVLMTPRGIEWAMMMTDVLELTARTVLDAAPLGPLKEIGPKDLAELDEIMKIRGLPMPGAPGEVASLVELYYD